jgi:acetylornithine/N-succinyldiaminopimelate aminotransferase
MTKTTVPVNAAELLETAQKHLYPNYAQPQIIIDHGRGAALWDTEGRRYVDFYAGIAVSTLGHAHPRLVSAIAEQAARVMHLSNYYYTAPNLELAGRLCALTGMDRAFFCNSGTEAMEASLKLTRRYFFDAGSPDRNVILAFDNSFHGRTMGALAATGQKKYREGFGPLTGVVHAPYGDLARVQELLSDKIAGVVVEPIQGEGGVIPAPPGFLKGLRELCDKSGALLIADEIQTGIGRTGTFLAFDHEGIKPDVVALAKALGGGFPIGAMLCRKGLEKVLPPGSHGTTFGGNPLASAAALAVLSVVEEEGLVERAGRLGQTLSESLAALASKHACVASARGKGLLQGLVLTDPAQGPHFVSALREAGLLVTFAGGVALRITPPLNITDAELSEGLQILDTVLGAHP